MQTACLLRDARRSAGLTQAALAERAGTSQAAVARYESGSAVPTLRTLDRLLRATGHELHLVARPAGHRLDGRLGRLLVAHRDALLAIAERHGASDLRVFGSVARGDEHANSDVDLLVDVPHPSYVRLEELRRDLEEELGARVDLAVEALLRDGVRERTVDEAVPL